MSELLLHLRALLFARHSPVTRLAARPTDLAAAGLPNRSVPHAARTGSPREQSRLAPEPTDRPPVRANAPALTELDLLRAFGCDV